MISLDTNTATAPAEVWNTYAPIRDRPANRQRRAELTGMGITSDTLRAWPTLDAPRQHAIRAALGLA